MKSILVITTVRFLPLLFFIATGQQLVAADTLSVNPASFNLAASVGAPSAQQSLQITALKNSVTWNATATMSNGTGWLSVSPPSGTATANQSSTLTVNINYAALDVAGVYQGSVIITDTATNTAVTVPVTVSLTAAQGRLQLSQSSVTFTVANGGDSPPSQVLQFSNSGQGNLAWSIPGSVLPSWLNISPLSGTLSGGSPTSPVGLSVNNVEAQKLSVGAYQVLISIAAPGASNNPQLLPVTLIRVPSSAPAIPVLSSNGIIFVAAQGGAAPTSQTLTLANDGGGGSLRAVYTVEIVSGGNWLSALPSFFGVGSLQIFVNQSGLQPGIYRANIHGSFSSGADQFAQVVLVVVPPGTPIQPMGGLQIRPAAGACTPTDLAMAASSIGNGVSVPTSFPKVLTVTLLDSCGSSVSDASVLANVEGHTIVLQSLGNGIYSGTWTPRQAGSIPLTITALRAGLNTTTLSLTVSAFTSASGAQLPVLFDDGVVEGAGFTPRRPLAPGSIVSLFGARLATQETFASNIPLDRQLAGVRVRIGSQDAPLYYAAGGQINAQVPSELSPGSSVSIAIGANGLFTVPQNYLVAPAEPGIFVAGGNGAILDGRSNLVTASNPARIGDTLQIFANGLGATTPAVTSGAAAPSSSSVTVPVTVTVGGVNVPVVYQGLAPGFVGLYQVNVVLVSGVPTGDGIPVVITQNGIASNPTLPATIPIRQP